MEPFLLTPAYKDYLWGGNSLKALYGKNSELAPLAETWECSAHPDGMSIIATGPYTGWTLAKYIKYFPETLGEHGQEYTCLPILVKLIDAEKDLSIQVHPDDAFAKKHEGQPGKTEMWYVLCAQPGATLVYGFAHDVTPELVQSAIVDNTLLEHLQKVPVHSGDVFLIEPGTVHAIGGGVLLAEVQENSNVTYRLYDYGRRGKDGRPRQLHIEKALAVMNFAMASPVRQQQRVIRFTPGMARELVARCRYFQVERLHIAVQGKLLCTPETFYVLLVMEGEGYLYSNERRLSLTKGNTVFVPASREELIFEGNMQTLLVRI